MERIRLAFGFLIKQRWWWPACSLLIITFAIHFLRKPESDFRAPHFLKLVREVKVDEPVEFDDFAILADTSPKGPDLVTDQDLDQLRGARYFRGMKAGELLRWADLESSSARVRRQIPTGHRAYLIQPENARLVRAGDWVDILLSPKREGEDPLVLAEKVQVLERLPSRSGEKGKIDLIVAMRQRELELLEKAKQQGKLSVAVLGKEEGLSRRTSLPSPRHRLGRAKKPASPRRSNQFEIITGAE